jgi:hypothetical protein
MAGDVVRAHDNAVLHDVAEDPATDRQITDKTSPIRRHSTVVELHESSVIIDDTESSIARAREFDRCIQRFVNQRLHVHLLDDRWRPFE